jgi:branched-subunit amino acid transport protein
MDHLNLRTGYFLGFMFAALISALLLRHTLHIYGGFSPEEIRQYTIVALVAVVFTIMFSGDAKPRNSHFHDDDPPNSG